MIIREDKRNVQTVGDIEESGFTIKASPKAFGILSSGIYSNKIGAIVRELGTNALDSNKMAGVTDPIKIHLPNSLDCTFKVRDNGIGMSHEDVTTVFTSYFESTKTHSDEFNGMLGLGSKSPFSYSDSFVVNCFDGEKKRIYSCFINEKEVPAISLLGEVECDEPCGVEIVVPVRVQDITEFKENAQTIYSVFDTIPVSYDGEPVAERKDVFYSYGNWKVLSAGGRFAIVQGNVCYTIDLNRIDWSQFPSRYKKPKDITIYRSIVFDVPNGTVDFSSSRESLHYNDRTKKAVYDLILQFYNDIDNVIKEEVDKCKTLHEWISLEYADAENAGIIYTMKRIVYTIFSDTSSYILAYPYTGYVPGYIKTFLSELENKSGPLDLKIINTILFEKAYRPRYTIPHLPDSTIMYDYIAGQYYKIGRDHTTVSTRTYRRRDGFYSKNVFYSSVELSKTSIRERLLTWMLANNKYDAIFFNDQNEIKENYAGAPAIDLSTIKETKFVQRQEKDKIFLRRMVTKYINSDRRCVAFGECSKIDFDTIGENEQILIVPYKNDKRPVTPFKQSLPVIKEKKYSVVYFLNENFLNRVRGDKRVTILTDIIEDYVRNMKSDIEEIIWMQSYRHIFGNVYDTVKLLKRNKINPFTELKVAFDTIQKLSSKLGILDSHSSVDYNALAKLELYETFFAKEVEDIREKFLKEAQKLFDDTFGGLSKLTLWAISKIGDYPGEEDLTILKNLLFGKIDELLVPAIKNEDGI